MPLWGTSADAATNKPKWLPDDANSAYDKTKVYATQSGWVARAGTAASGNGNTSAQEEVLVAIGGLAGATAATGLEHPTMTKYRILTSTAHGTTGNITFEISYDEKVKYVEGSAATLVLTAGTGNNPIAALTHIDGVSLATNLTGNTLRFTATSLAATTYDLADDVAMQNRTDLQDAITGTALELASGKFTSAVKTAIGYSQITVGS